MIDSIFMLVIVLALIVWRQGRRIKILESRVDTLSCRHADTRNWIDEMTETQNALMQKIDRRRRLVDKLRKDVADNES